MHTTLLGLLLAIAFVTVGIVLFWRAIRRSRVRQDWDDRVPEDNLPLDASDLDGDAPDGFGGGRSGGGGGSGRL